MQHQWQYVLLLALLTSGEHSFHGRGHASAEALDLQRGLLEQPQSVASGSSDEVPLLSTAPLPLTLPPDTHANPTNTLTLQDNTVKQDWSISSVLGLGSRTLKLPFTSLNQPITPDQYVLDVKFYIHDDPNVFDHFSYEKLGPCLRSRMKGDDAWKHEISDKAQYTAEIFILEQLRIHPKRTMDPEQATLFYIPVLSVLSFWAKECETFANRTTTHENRMVGPWRVLISLQVLAVQSRMLTSLLMCQELG